MAGPDFEAAGPDVEAAGQVTSAKNQNWHVIDREGSVCRETTTTMIPQPLGALWAASRIIKTPKKVLGRPWGSLGLGGPWDPQEIPGELSMELPEEIPWGILVEWGIPWTRNLFFHLRYIVLSGSSTV